jgi:hypothetical protein
MAAKKEGVDVTITISRINALKLKSRYLAPAKLKNP